MEKIENRQYQFDFIKGIAIISVILLHVGIPDKYFPMYWIGQAVPLFIIISCLLSCLVLSKNSNIVEYFKRDKIKRTLYRIFMPFIFAQILLVIIYIALKQFSFKGFLRDGGIGPGSYYPWLYLQLWILIPFMFLLMKRNVILGSILIILVSVATNIIFSVLGTSELMQIPFVNNKKEVLVSLYRLCVTRYLFLFPLSYLLLEQKIKYIVLLFFGFVSAGFLYCSIYKGINLEPILYNSGWRDYEFPSHFYTLLVFIFLYKIYDYIPKVIQDIVNKIGKHSWEIFNIQMVYFTINGYLNINKYVNLLLSLFICIMPVYTYKFMSQPIKMSGYIKHGHST